MKQLALISIVALSMAGMAWAQQAGPAPDSLPHPPPGATPAGANQMAITPGEVQKLYAVRAKVLQTYPDLVAKNIKLQERMRAFEIKLHAAMIKADPTVARIFAELQRARSRQIFTDLQGAPSRPGMPPSPPPVAPPPVSPVK